MHSKDIIFILGRPFSRAVLLLYLTKRDGLRFIGTTTIIHQKPNLMYFSVRLRLWFNYHVL